jgi:transcription-repair coupling factor (superfamily II helicase)
LTVLACYLNHTKNLFATHRIKLQAAELGIRKIDAHAQGGRLEFAKDTKVQPMTIVKLSTNAARTIQIGWRR